MSEAVWPASTPQKTGMMIVVVGPSGAGKDSVIGYALERLGDREDVHLVQRAITRPANAGGERHEAVSETTFEGRLTAGEFAVSWKAHGLRYGVPTAAQHDVAQGDVVIANGSRAVLDQFSEAFPSLLIVNIVARPEVLAERLQKRGRETAADIQLRLERADTFAIPARFPCVTIDNSGPLHEAGEQFVAVIEALLQEKAVTPA